MEHAATTGWDGANNTREEAGKEPPLTPQKGIRSSSQLGAFSHTPFVVMWVATTVSLTGLAISDTSSAWLMTTLNPDPRAVSLVQVASSLPMFLCTVPAGALADMVEARRFLILLETLVVLLMALLGGVVYLHRLTPIVLLSTPASCSIRLARSATAFTAAS